MKQYGIRPKRGNGPNLESAKQLTVKGASHD